jgi:hypothetical protein
MRGSLELVIPDRNQWLIFSQIEVVLGFKNVEQPDKLIDESTFCLPKKYASVLISKPPFPVKSELGFSFTSSLY